MRFDTLDKLQGEEALVFAAFDEAYSDMREVMTAINDRFRAQSEYMGQRQKELQKLIADSESESVQRMARKELVTLNASVLFPTEAEQAEFDEAFSRAMSALGDMGNLHAEYRTASNEAVGMIEAQRKEIMQHDPALRREWINGLWNDFHNTLMKGVEVVAQHD